MNRYDFWKQHHRATRRYFLRFSTAGAAAFSSLPLAAFEDVSDSGPDRDALQSAIGQLPSWLTAQNDFQDVSRGNPKPHTLTEEKRNQVGLTRATWQLEVVSDPDNPSRLRSPLTHDDGTALKFSDLMELAKTHAVRFPKVMTCLNIGCPLGNGIWEGVPLREVLWMTQPTADLRRVFYHGYHNDDDSQLFRSSLPVGRVLEDTFGLPPVILCYKLNGQWLSPERGGPVRVVVPEAYGFKSIKWLSHVFLSNIPHANDTYGEKNNDVDSPMKTFCATLSIPASIQPNQPIPMTGWAQSGISGLEKVQVWIQNKSETWQGDRYFSQAPWRDAEILPLPKSPVKIGWEDDSVQQIPDTTMGFENGVPKRWPIRLTQAHWATMHPGLPTGEYVLRCRTVDQSGIAQPMPRPFRKSGHAAIEERQLVVG